MTVLIITGVILALLGLLALSPAKVYVIYKKNEESLIKISASVGLIKFSLYDSSRDKKQKEKPDKEDKDKEKKEEKKKPMEVLERIKDYFEEIFDIISFLKKRMIIYNFQFYTRIGMGDAASTGILTGTAWGILYDILAVFEHNFVLKKHDIKVAPDFMKETLIIDFESVIGLKTVYDLYIISKFLIPKGRKEK